VDILLYDFAQFSANETPPPTYFNLGKGKGKFPPGTGHEDPEGE
jgi:hypothetical protein